YCCVSQETVATPQTATNPLDCLSHIRFAEPNESDQIQTYAKIRFKHWTVKDKRRVTISLRSIQRRTPQLIIKACNNETLTLFRAAEIRDPDWMEKNNPDKDPRFAGRLTTARAVPGAIILQDRAFYNNCTPILNH